MTTDEGIDVLGSVLKVHTPSNLFLENWINGIESEALASNRKQNG